jgi:uncharacterized protein (UPF0332 family)
MDVDAERWLNLAEDALAACGVCYRAGRFRSAVSRAYYACFSFATARLLSLGERLPEGRTTWGHGLLPGVLNRALGRLEVFATVRRNAVHQLRAAYAMRIDADYRPGRTVDERTAREALRDALAIRGSIGRVE